MILPPHSPSHPTPPPPMYIGGWGVEGCKRPAGDAHARALLLYRYLFFLMAKIEQYIIDKVIETADIVDVVGDFVTLRKAGVNRTGICPFHDDKHDGNFIVRPKGIKNGGNTYRCFVCDAKGDSVKFLMEHERLSFPDAIRWLGKKYNIEVDDVPLNYTPPPPRPTPPPPPTLEIPRSWVKRTMEMAGDRNLFCYWLSQLPWSENQRKRLNDTLWMYCVGGWRDGRVVFWQIDADGVPRAAKLMKYLTDGHRDKEAHPGWIYNQDGCRQKLFPDNCTIEKPLFGAHLLKRYPQAIVNLVESEKTALIMANYYGDPDRQLWLACGGLKHLRLEAMQPLIDQGRTVWLWPDKDGVKEWQDVAEKLGSEKVQVYSRFFETCWKPEDGEKADAADITIRMMRTGEGPREVEEEEVAMESQHTELIWNSNEPFLDPDEAADPRVREWREKMSQVHSQGWGK